MASLGDVFSDQEMTNWLKAWLALNITKDGLHDFIDREVQNFQIGIIQSVTPKLSLPTNTKCTSCFTANLLKCPTPRICKKCGLNSVCKSMHNTPGKQHRPCPNKICDAFLGEIIKEHRYKCPSWNNTSAEQWASNHWEVAKCYMPAEGYLAVSSIQNTDFNGVISVMLNCKHFDSKVSFSIAPQQPSAPCLLTKARGIGTAVRHSSDCKVTGTDLQDYFLTLDTLLKDSQVLAHDRSAQDAVRKLNKLQTDSLNISVADVSQLLKDAQKALKKAKQVSEESKSELKTYIQQCQTELDEHLHTRLEECAKDIKKNAETCTEESKRELDKHTQRSIDLIQKANSSKEIFDYEQAVEELRRLLIQHYKRNVAYTPVNPLMPSLVKPLMEIYATPKIHQIKTEKNGTRKKGERVYKYRDIFHTEQKTKQNIFLQGEPGKGKSSFASKLVVDWCNECSSVLKSTEKETAFDDAETLHKFKFVFHIALRDSRNQRNVTEMIRKQIIETIYADDDIKTAYRFLQTSMKKETCLVVQDGLDEWFDPEKENALPILASSFECTALITTRPWKMSDELLTTSDVDKLLEIEGVNDPFVLSKNILECLVSENLNPKLDAFKSYIHRNKLEELLSTPMLLTLIVCLWVDTTYLTGSACEMYSILLDSLLKKAKTKTAYFRLPPFKCLENTKYFEPNESHIESISKAAFHLLFTVEKGNTLVFSDKQLSNYLSEAQKVFALTTGILTERKLSTLSYRPSTCAFIHKSVQEFLAALYIARNVELIDSDLAQYYENHPNAGLEMSQVFIFLCGLNITAANKISCAIDGAVYQGFGDSAFIDEYFMDLHDQRIQDVIIAGYLEGKANEVQDSDIHLQLGCFNFNVQNNKDVLECILLKNMSNVRSLVILSNCFSPDLGEQVTLLPNALRGLQKLEIINLECKYDGLDLSSCHSLWKIVLGEQVTLIPNTLHDLQKLKYIELKCKYDGLDLSSCHGLEVIVLGKQVTLIPNTLHDLPKLKIIELKCKYDGLD